MHDRPSQRLGIVLSMLMKLLSLAKPSTEASLSKDTMHTMTKEIIETERHPMGNFSEHPMASLKKTLRWDKSNNDFPVELAEVDLLKHENKEESSSISPDGEKTVPVVIRWHEPAKSGDLR